MIGMFAVAEILRNVVSTQKMEPPRMERLLNVFAGVGRTLVKYWRGLMRGNIIGTAIGILPGAGGEIAAWVTYALSQKMSKEQEQVSTGPVARQSGVQGKRWTIRMNTGGQSMI